MIQKLVAAWKMLDDVIRKKLFLVFISFLLLAILEIFGLSMVFPVLAILVEPGFIDENPWLSSFYEMAGFASHNNFIYLLLFIMLLSIVGKNLGAIFLNRWQFRFLAYAQAEQSKKMFELYLRMPYMEYLKRDTGFFMYAINSASSLFYSSLVQQTLIILTEIVTLTLLMAVLIMTNPTASLLAILVMSLCGLLIYKVTSNKLSKIGEDNRKYSEKNIRQIKESFNGFKEIRVMGKSDKFTHEFNNTMDTLSVNRAQQLTYIMYTRHIIEIVLILIVVLVTSITISSQNAGVAIGQLSLFGVITLRILPSITRVISSTQIIRTAEAPAELLKKELEYLNDWELEPSGQNSGEIKSVPIDLELRDVSFSYNDSDEKAVDDINLKVEFGEIVGVAGPSGSGKTTLADIMLGVIYPGHGLVLANGKDINNDIKYWRSQIAYVPQKITFISGSIRSNIAFELAEHEISDEKVIQCLKQAQLDEKVMSLDGGIYHQMSEDASNLSGGEKQRLGIARALYNDASILILDEATSSLDVETEHNLTNVINKLRGHRTVILIAHRLSTLQDCDRIIFMEDGNILAFSDFRTLQETHPSFKRMVNLSQIDPQHLI